jgi:aminocarboxymuconate-semialdehyde decarboxylase
VAVDVHAHYFPSSILSEVRQATKLGVSYSAGDRVLTFPSGPARPLFPALSDLEARVEWNRAQGIQLQVVSPWLDIAGDDLKGAQAVAWSGLLNDGVAAEIDDHGGFVAFAALPVDDGGSAAAELQRCVNDLGFVGGALPTQVDGKNLPDAGLEELFAAAEILNAPLFLHPFRVLGADRLISDFMTNTCGNPFETTVAALSLFFDGTFDRHPRLRVLLSHCGGALPLIAGRAARGSQVNPRVRRRAESPSEILDLFYYDTVVHDVQALAFAIARVGPERCALGSDVPFPMVVDDPVQHVRAALRTAGLEDAGARLERNTAAELVGQSLVPVRELH